jgi:hypothetical protein
MATSSPQHIPVRQNSNSSQDERLQSYFNAAAASSPPTNYTEVNSLLKHRQTHSSSPTKPSASHSPTVSVGDPYESGSGFDIRIISGNGNRPLAGKIAALLGKKTEDCHVASFADGEIDIQIKNNVRGADVYVIQPVSPPTVNKHLMELLLLVHTLKLSSAKRITAIVPYYPYSRQDRFVILFFLSNIHPHFSLLILILRYIISFFWSVERQNPEYPSLLPL